MKNENEKISLFARLTGGKDKKKSCCCNFEVEEIPEENDSEKNKETKKEDNGKPCCK